MATKDNAEYISYLESKKEEKLVAIQVLAEGNKRDQEGFLEKKKMYKEAYEMKIAGTFILIMSSFLTPFATTILSKNSKTPLQN